jgi:thermostable 8-oxoguanine DNA glycosylase
MEENVEWEDDDSISSSPPGHTRTQTQIKKILDTKKRDELLELLTDLSRRFPDVSQHIIENHQLISGQVNKLVRTLKMEIRNLTVEPAWHNHWRGEGELPDYNHRLKTN